jgi:DNA-directed RNA polymerase specialized sigma subunit
MNNLDIVKDYNKVVTALAVAKSTLHIKEIQLSKLIYPKEYHSPSFDQNGGGSKNDKPVTEIYEEVITLSSEIAKQKEHVKAIEDEKELLDKQIEAITKKCRDLEIQVFYYHYVKRLSLRETARIMSYSYQGLRKIHNKLKNI